MTRPDVFCGDLKILPWFRQSCLFSSSLAKTKEGSARRVSYPLRKRANSHQNGSYHTSNVQRAKRHTIIIKHNFLHPNLSRPSFLNRKTKIIARAPWNGGPQQPDGKFAGRLIFKRCFAWIRSTENLKYIMEMFMISSTLPFFFIHSNVEQLIRTKEVLTQVNVEYKQYNDV